MSNQMEEMKSLHRSELGHSRAESTELNAELNQKMLSMSALSDKASALERELREKDEAKERKQAELTVSLTHPIHFFGIIYVETNSYAF